MKKATTVGELIAVLQQFHPEQPVIGHECRASISVVQQDTGAVLVNQSGRDRVAPPGEQQI